MKVKETREVALAEILVGEYEARVAEEDPGLTALAASIRTFGLLTALGVVETEKGLQLVHGHRRYSACVMARVTRVRVDVLEGTTAEMERASIVENYHRRDISPVERAAQIANAVSRELMPVEELAETFGRSVTWIREQVAMMDWPADVLEAVHAGSVSVAAAMHLARVTDDSYREFLVNSARESGCSGRTAAAWLQGWRAMQPVEEVVTMEAPPVEGGPRVEVPRTLCMGCGESYRPDGLVMVYVCPACVTALQGGGRVVDRQGEAVNGGSGRLRSAPV